MTDPNIIYTAAHTAAKCVPHIKTITHNIGVHYMTAFIAAVISSLIFGVAGFFVGKRGLIGTKKDINNAVTQIEKVPSEVKAAEAAVIPSHA